MRVKVLKSFIDKQKEVIHQEGKIIELTEERFEEIKSADGSLIEEVEGEYISEFPKHIGGGYYELSNGEKVKGKDAAIAAQTEIE